MLTDSVKNAENSLVAAMHSGDLQHDFQTFSETQIIKDYETQTAWSRFSGYS